MSKRRSSNPLAGCLPGLLLFGAMIVILLYGSKAPTGGGGALVAPWLFWLMLVAGAAFVMGVARGKVGFAGILIAAAVVVALIALNGTDAMPLVDNPCPGDEVVIAAGERCYGMDGHANRAWLESKVGR